MIQQGAFETVVLFSRPKRLLQKETNYSTYLMNKIMCIKYLTQYLAHCSINVSYYYIYQILDNAIYIKQYIIEIMSLGF